MEGKGVQPASPVGIGPSYMPYMPYHTILYHTIHGMQMQASLVGPGGPGEWMDGCPTYFLSRSKEAEGGTRRNQQPAGGMTGDSLIAARH